MELDKKVVAAISTAVTAYVEAERSASVSARSLQNRQGATSWSQSGRAEIMRNRQLWQLRIVPR